MCYLFKKDNEYSPFILFCGCKFQFLILGALIKRHPVSGEPLWTSG